MPVEQEAKFYVKDLAAVEARLQGLGGRLTHPRTHEFNLRFDTQDGALLATSQMLRLRQTDSRVTVTYKGPMENPASGVNIRQEIEFSASDFTLVEELFTALGYIVSFKYEKYRTTYRMGVVQIMLDETPIGAFVEVEGDSDESIQAIAKVLALDMTAHISVNYYDLFLRAIRNLSLSVRDMTFENFQPFSVPISALEVVPAD